MTCLNFETAPPATRNRNPRRATATARRFLLYVINKGAAGAPPID